MTRNMAALDTVITDLKNIVMTTVAVCICDFCLALNNLFFPQMAVFIMMPNVSGKKHIIFDLLSANALTTGFAQA